MTDEFTSSGRLDRGPRDLSVTPGDDAVASRAAQARAIAFHTGAEEP